ncbi:MAG: hypothetical protein A2452_12310 [Candidatus Firestonebacteria bacterium RIFOXYC2_FULL_39_67]|nr:MAG: hypothetical protein A2536_07840 [Candidatus Firestonebacteria bacterium RIFOXYD2_FULL_39_29]OGF55631.1 MAG: hypothetical protein A2452_12310 [Candidatus Firestonebacteria bacterium RIFOXYC2_FULL_39_67]
MIGNIEQLLKVLGTRTPEAVEAAKALAKKGVPALCLPLKRPESLSSPQGRHAIARLLFVTDISKIMSNLLDAIASKDWRPVQTAGDVLYAMGRRSAPILIKYLETEKRSEGKINAMFVLQRISTDEAGKAIEKIALTDKDPNVRSVAVMTLGMIGAFSSKDTVVKVLRDKSLDVRFSAVKSAGYLRIKEAAKQIVKIVEKEKDPKVKAVGIYSLDRIGNPEVAKDILGFLKDSDAYVRWSAAVALRRIWNDSCRPILKKMKDPDKVVASAILETMQICCSK